MTEEPNIQQYLPNINSPADLRKIPVGELPRVCDELRHDIIHELSVNPGHLASSLGVVELTVALHYVFDTPYDRIVWDVGHQAYGHKILTGRRDRFCTNRRLGGLRPFPFPTESEYDTFCCGHASNSISAALGMAVAARLKGENRQVVAVIGDGAMSGGLSFEGINNAASTPNDLLVILNDNNMSIDDSVGGMRQYLLRLTTNTTYNNLRYRASRKLFDWGILNEKRRKSIIRFNNSMKSLLTRQQNMFEGMDIRYFGPTDGHDVVELVRVLRAIKEMKGPKLLHIHTVKGKGYAPAEENATVWHAPGKFDEDTGQRIDDKPAAQCPPRFQDVFGETLLELAQQNPRIVGVTPAMPTGCSMNIMMHEMPERTFDVGIAEGHAVTFSGGMAKDGLLPFCNIYSSFMQRAYDNIIHDAAIMRLNMVLCLDRAGLVGEDGPTHHGAFDLAFLRPIPNLTIASPYDETELRRLMFTAQQKDMGTFVIPWPCSPSDPSALRWRKPSTASTTPCSNTLPTTTCAFSSPSTPPCWPKLHSVSPTSSPSRTASSAADWAAPYWSFWPTTHTLATSGASAFPTPSSNTAPWPNSAKSATWMPPASSAPYSIAYEDYHCRRRRCRHASGPPAFKRKYGRGAHRP